MAPSVDKVYATNEQTVEHLHAAAGHFVGVTEGLDKATSVGEVCKGNNPFKCITNVVEGFVDLPQNRNVRFRLWLPENGAAPKATVILLHGYGEHTGRYHHVAHALAGASYQVFGYDQKFHGEDEHAVGASITKINSFDEFIDDAESFIKIVGEKYSDIPYFLMGHSMGGCVALLTTLRMQDTWKCRGVVLSSPAIRVKGNILAPNPYMGFFSRLTKTLSSVAPSFPSPGVDAKKLSKDKNVVKHARDDPLMFGDKISARFARHFVIGGTVDAQKRTVEMKSPFLVVTGTKDKIVNYKAARKLVDEASSEDKEYKEWEGGYHEQFNEDHRDEVIDYVKEWMDNRL